MKCVDRSRRSSNGLLAFFKYVFMYCAEVYIENPLKLYSNGLSRYLIHTPITLSTTICWWYNYVLYHLIVLIFSSFFYSYDINIQLYVSFSSKCTALKLILLKQANNINDYFHVQVACETFCLDDDDALLEATMTLQTEAITQNTVRFVEAKAEPVTMALAKYHNKKVGGSHLC